MTRRAPLLTLLACLLALAGCGGSRNASKSTTSGVTRHAITTSTSRGKIAAAAQEFAVAYVRFLDGAGTASGLAATTPTVRALAGQAGPVPAARRRGTLVIAQLRPAVGATGSYLLTARDDAHAFYAQMTLAQQHGQWVVAQFTPPDLVQVFAPAGPAPPPPPPGSTAAKASTQLFLRGYLPWLYGQTPLRAISAAAGGLLTNLKAHPPRVPPTIHSLAAKVAAIAMQRHGRGWQALANITDGNDTYELVLTVAQTRGMWLVNKISASR